MSPLPRLRNSIAASAYAGAAPNALRLLRLGRRDSSAELAEPVLDDDVLSFRELVFAGLDHQKPPIGCDVVARVELVKYVVAFEQHLFPAGLHRNSNDLPPAAEEKGLAVPRPNRTRASFCRDLASTAALRMRPDEHFAVL